VRAGLDGVSAARLMARACRAPHIHDAVFEAPVHVVAAGKAAAAMAAAFMGEPDLLVRSALAIGTHQSPHRPSGFDWMPAGHPFPDARSLAAADAALDRAHRVGPGERMILLLSGGASALMARPADGLSLEDKVAASRCLMLAGADIHQLNTLRKHLSSVKGGWLAAACEGAVTTLAISDVVGDDPSVIGSGPGVADPSSWLDVARAVGAFDVRDGLPDAVCRRIDDGLAGRAPDTPKPGDPRLARASAHVIGRAADAVAAARGAAEALGYRTVVIDAVVTGEARNAAPRWLAHALRLARDQSAPACVLSSGETTVHVQGPGRGGRNLEFALALVDALAGVDGVVAGSVGTDGIDGSTDVAGALVDHATARRARGRGLPSPSAILDRNDSLAFFAPLGDTVRTGRTETNVGDLQVLVWSDD
jgi:hydroxypyruvate reductase